MRIFDEIPEHIDIDNPKFSERTNIHDWRKYVHDDLEQSWKELTYREKKIIYVMCEERAEAEEWE